MNLDSIDDTVNSEGNNEAFNDISFSHKILDGGKKIAGGTKEYLLHTAMAYTLSAAFYTLSPTMLRITGQVSQNGPYKREPETLPKVFGNFTGIMAGIGSLVTALAVLMQAPAEIAIPGFAVWGSIEGIDLAYEGSRYYFFRNDTPTNGTTLDSAAG